MLIETSPALAFDSVTHRYGDLIAVENLTLNVGVSEVVCLVGPSGCGKSTILRLASGLETIQEGRISIYGRLVSQGGKKSVAPEDRKIGLVFQDLALFPHLNVVENVMFGMKNLQATGKREAAVELLSRVGMKNFAASYPHALSGGEQQRVALVRALAPRPKLMLLDEPFSDLDTRLRSNVRADTLEVLRKSETPVLLVTHDPGEAMLMADRVIFVNRGRLIQEGPPAKIYSEPKSKFVASFFGDINILQGVFNKNVVECALGKVTVFGLSVGKKVEVVIRNEAFSLFSSATTEGVPAKVRWSRVIGPYSIVGVELDSNGFLITAHIPGIQPPVDGSVVWVGFDRKLAFVFPADSDL